MEKAYKPQYKCGICGTVFGSVSERMNCESACLKKQEEEVKKAAEAKKLEEKKIRKEEIEMMHKNLNEKINSYVADYGSLHIDDVFMTDDNTYHNLSKLLGWWF